MKNEDIRKAFDRLTPDEDTKERMLKSILERAETAQKTENAGHETIPWYMRFSAQIGVCASVVVCAGIFAVIVMNPAFIKQKLDNNEFLETMSVSEPIVSGVTEPPAVETLTSTTTRLKEENTLISETSVADRVIDNKIMASLTEIVVTETKKTCPTEESTVITTLTKKQTSELTETEPSCTTYDSEVVSTTSSHLSLYGDLFDFNYANWAGRSYATDYAEVPYSKLEGYMGSGVASGDNVNGTYTILLYKIKDVPIEEGFAVQYIGQNLYYEFYNVE